MLNEIESKMSHSTLIQVLTLAIWVALLSWSTAALADDNYGAIAFSQSTGNYGFSYDYDSRASAEARAREKCGDHNCTVVLWFVNACGALATGDGNAYGTGWASSRREAENIAMSNCRGEASGCSVIRWACTTH